MPLMNEIPNNQTSRREFIKNSGKVAAASALAGVAIPRVHGAESNTIQVALVGCGGRGGGAAANALSVKACPIKLVAMADVFNNRLKASYEALHGELANVVEVPEDRKLIEDGEIGDLILLRGYRMHGPVGSAFSTKWPGQPSELLWQIQRFHSFLWASGGCYSDFYIHHIDHLCWMKNAWPIKAQALGGRHNKLSGDGQPFVDQNFDTYSVEYTFADGSKFILDGRCINGCEPRYYSFAHGSKGMAIVSKS